MKVYKIMFWTAVVLGVLLLPAILVFALGWWSLVPYVLGVVWCSFANGVIAKSEEIIKKYKDE